MKEITMQHFRFYVEVNAVAVLDVEAETLEEALEEANASGHWRLTAHYDTWGCNPCYVICTNPEDFDGETLYDYSEEIPLDDDQIHITSLSIDGY